MKKHKIPKQTKGFMIVYDERDLSFRESMSLVQEAVKIWEEHKHEDIAIRLPFYVHAEDAKMLGTMLASRLQMKVILQKHDGVFWLTPVDPEPSEEV